MALGKSCNPCHNVHRSSGWTEEPAADGLEEVTVGDASDGEQVVQQHTNEQQADNKQGASTSEWPLQGPTEEFKMPMSPTVSVSTPVPALDDVIAREKPAEVPVPAAAMDGIPVEDSTKPGPAVVPETFTVGISEATPAKTGPAEVSMEVVEASMDEADAGPPIAATAMDAAYVSACLVENGSAVQAVEMVSDVPLNTREEAVGASESEAPAAVETWVVCDVPVDVEHVEHVQATEGDVAEATGTLAIKIPGKGKSNEVVNPGAGEKS